MGEYRKIDYTQVALPEELLTSFAKAMLPELRISRTVWSTSA